VHQLCLKSVVVIEEDTSKFFNDGEDITNMYKGETRDKKI